MSFYISAGIETTGIVPLDEVERRLAELVRATATEPGCLSFEIRQNLEDPNKFTLWECWTDPEALNAHFAYPHTKEVIDAGITRVLYIEKLGAIGADAPAPSNLVHG